MKNTVSETHWRSKIPSMTITVFSCIPFSCSTIFVPQSANTATHTIAPIHWGRTGIVVYLVPSPNAWRSLREGRGWRPRVLDYVTCGRGAGDVDKNSSCWELVLYKEARLFVELSGEGGSWSWAELEVGRVEGLWLTVSKTCTGHSRCYQEDQPELAAQCLLYSVDAVILHDNVNVPGPKYVSQDAGASSFKWWCNLCSAVV